MKSYKINDVFLTKEDRYLQLFQDDDSIVLANSDLLPLTRALIDNMTKREQLDLFYLLHEKITGGHIEIPGGIK